MRKLFAIIFAVLMCTAFSLSVFAYEIVQSPPPNSFFGSVSFGFSLSSGGSDVVNLPNSPFGLGSTYVYRFQSSTGLPQLNFHSSVSIDLTSPNNFLYIAVYGNIDDYEPFNTGLSAYRYPSGDLYIDGFTASSVPSYTVRQSDGVYTLVRQADGSFSAPLNDVMYVCYKDVPSGSFTFDSGYKLSGTSWYYYVFGVYGQYSSPPTLGDSTIVQDVGSIMDQVSSGSLSFSDALDQLNQAMEAAVSNSSSPCEAQFAISLTQHYIEQLYNSSFNDSSFTADLDSFQTSLNTQLSRLLSGQANLSTFQSNILAFYRRYLSYCDTPEQASIVNSLFQSFLAQSELRIQEASAQELDAAISDEELSKADDYYEREDALLAEFDQTKFEAQLDFERWFARLDVQPTSTLKSYFDYLIGSSSLSLFIIIPLSLTLVRILLGTVMHLPSRKG